MTIATDSGFVVGKKYEVISETDDYTTNGEIVTFKRDDGSSTPLFFHENGREVFIGLHELIPYTVEKFSGNKTPSPRFRKKRISPPVRLKTDIRVTYQGDIGYTITNAKRIIVSKESGNVFITSDIKGIITTVELPLKDIDSIKVKTPKGIYDIFVEGAYPSILIINKTEGLTFSGGYFSLNLDNK